MERREAMTSLRQLLQAFAQVTEVLIDLVWALVRFPRAPFAEGEPCETNSKPSDWTESEIRRSIWENEADGGPNDRQPQSSSAARLDRRDRPPILVLGPCLLRMQERLIGQGSCANVPRD